MNAFDPPFRGMRATHHFAQGLAGRMLAIADRRWAIAGTTSGGLFPRKPSRGIIVELADLVAVSPIIFGLAAVVAMPLPQQATSPAPRPSVYGGLAGLAAPAPETLSERGRQVAKSSNRAPARASQSSTNPPLIPAPSVESSQLETTGVDWRSVQVAVAEDGRLIVDGKMFRLAGIVMPNMDAACRRLDGVEVRCIDRVIARLTILTQQHGAVSCRAIVEASGERFAKCLAGKTDLADDLVQTRLARRS